MFTQPCFVKLTKNIPSILDDLGYTYQINYLNGYPIDLDQYRLIGVNLYATGTYIGLNKSTNKSWINCNSNIDLFIALASIRDDSDRNQWFCSNYFNECMDPDEWRFCTKDNYIDFFGDCPYVRNYDDYHKATPLELINKFK